MMHGARHDERQRPDGTTVSRRRLIASAGGLAAVAAMTADLRRSTARARRPRRRR